MFKENGRKKPADSKETASVLGKPYECSHCGHKVLLRNIEFGETPKCPRCSENALTEVVDV